MLLILDGWSYRKEITADNAIEQGHTPNWHRCLQEYPHCLIQTSGLAVGLPDGQMGNRKSATPISAPDGWLCRICPRLTLRFKNGSLAENPVLLKLIDT